MALFHLSVRRLSEAQDRSAIASAAYRAERLYSEYYGEYSDYTRKGSVISSDILLPSHTARIRRPSDPMERRGKSRAWEKNAQLA